MTSTTSKPSLRVLSEHLAEVESLARNNADNIAENQAQTQGSLKVLRLDLDAFVNRATLEISKLKVALSEATTKRDSLQSQLEDLRSQQGHHRVLLSLLSLGLALCGVAFGFGGLK